MSSSKSFAAKVCARTASYSMIGTMGLLLLLDAGINHFFIIHYYFGTLVLLMTRSFLNCPAFFYFMFLTPF